MKLSIIACTALICSVLTGCATSPLTTSSEPITRVPLAIQMPPPLRVNAPNWIIITPDTAAHTWAELQKKNVDLVLFAITDVGYEQLSLSYAQIRNLINEQREIILKYKEYYESEKKLITVPVNDNKPLTLWERLFGKTKLHAPAP